MTDAQSMSSSLCDVILYLLCRMDTQDMDCRQLSHQIDFYTGGIVYLLVSRHSVILIILGLTPHWAQNTIYVCAKQANF